MYFISSTIEKEIDSILNIASKSFNKFYTKGDIIERLKDKKYWLWIVKDNDKPIAFKIWYEELDRQIFSWLCAVLPEYRGRGIAQKLMDIQFKISKDKGYKRISLKTHKGHPEMISLCTKKGFIEFKREKNHWGDEREAIFFQYIVK